MDSIVLANQSVVNADVQESYPTFAEGDTLQDIVTLSGGNGVSDLEVRTTTDVSEPASMGEGLLFGCQSSNFYVQGHFVHAEKQLIVILETRCHSRRGCGF